MYLYATFILWAVWGLLFLLLLLYFRKTLYFSYYGALLQKLSYHWNFIFQGSVEAYNGRQAQSLLSHGLYQWANTVLLKWPMLH